MGKLIDKYTYRVEWDNDDKIHIANCLEFPSLKAHGNTPDEALKEVRAALSETLKWMKKENETIPDPLSMKKYKGNLTLRVPPELHKKLAVKSAEEGVSINQYILSKIA